MKFSIPIPISADFTPIARSLAVKISVLRGTELEEAINQLPYAAGRSLRKIGDNTQEAIALQFIMTKSPKSRGGLRGLPRIMDAITVEGPLFEGDDVVVGVGNQESIENDYTVTSRKGIAYNILMIQEEGKHIDPQPIWEYNKVGRIVLKGMTKEKDIPARHFLRAGLTYLETRAESDFEKYFTAELDKLGGT